MTGITGWVDYQRDLTPDRETLLAMTATMAGIGPDGEEIWTSRRYATGIRLLDVAGDKAAAGPFVLTADGEVRAVACQAGPLYNASDVRAELESSGHGFRTRGRAELVLRAYLAWGATFASRLDGAFSAAVWDARTQELVLARDRLGNKPLFYYPLPHGVLFGSLARAILANPLVETVVDLDGLRELLGKVGPPGTTVYRGMREVKPGHVLRVSPVGIREATYWALEGYQHTDGLQTTIQTIRGMLEDSVARQLPTDGSASVMLSG